MQFFFPHVHDGIDWMQGYDFLDKELQQVVRDAELGRRLVDKLVKVYTTEGKETWVLIHVEVQGKVETDFARRMYVYNYRLFDRYDRKIASLAVLADEQASWRPETFEYTLWKCEVKLQFDVVKLLDYRERESELEQSNNPCVMVALSYLKTRETRKRPDDRYYWKLRLFKILYERGYSKDDIVELTRFLDWIMVLPEELEQRFEENITQLTEEEAMRYIASYERIWLERGMKQGAEQGLQQGLRQGLKQGFLEGEEQGKRLVRLEIYRNSIVDILEARFAPLPRSIINKIHEIDDVSVLKELLKNAATTSSPEEYLTLLETSV